MNYYPFHIGDYASSTRHLSWDEDMAYRRMLDVYYTTEKPLPKDLRAVCRLVLATTEAQRAAVEVALREMFQETPDGWVNKRADEEIEAMRRLRDRQSSAAKSRWNKERTAPAMPRHTKPDAMASKNDAGAMPPTPTPTPTPTPREEQCSTEEPTKNADPPNAGAPPDPIEVRAVEIPNIVPAEVDRLPARPRVDPPPPAPPSRAVQIARLLRDRGVRCTSSQPGVLDLAGQTRVTDEVLVAAVTRLVDRGKASPGIGLVACVVGDILAETADGPLRLQPRPIERREKARNFLDRVHSEMSRRRQGQADIPPEEPPRLAIAGGSR